MIGIEEITEALTLLDREKTNPRSDEGSRWCLYNKKTALGTLHCIAGEIIASLLGEEMAAKLTENISINMQTVLHERITEKGLAFLQVIQAEADKKGAVWGEAIDRGLEWEAYLRA